MTTIDDKQKDLISARLRDFRAKHVHKMQNEAALILDVPQSVLSYAENGRKINIDLLTKLQTIYKLNADWLLYGKGSEIDKTPAGNKLITDINNFNSELTLLKRTLKIFEATQNHVLNLLDKQAQDIERQENEIAALKQQLSNK